MLMRKLPMRGEKLRIKGDHEEVTALEPMPDGYIKVIFQNGKTGSLQRSTLDLPVINTKDYEKI